MNVTVLGHVCIDQNTSEEVVYTGPGGAAVFISKVFSHFPATTTTVIAPYGADFHTHRKHIALHPPAPPNKKTLLYENTSYGDTRRQRALNREHATPIGIDSRMKELLATTDLFFFAPLTPAFSADYVRECKSYVSEKALSILLPQGYFRDFNSNNHVVQRHFREAEEIIPLFHFVILSNQDYQDGQRIAKKWAKTTQVIMTLGDKGALHMNQWESYVVPTRAVNSEDIVDSVGSGDIFSAAFGYKYLKTKNVHKSITFAHAIARQCLFYPADNLQFTIPKG